MDRHKIESNRHKNKEVFKSGSAKRKIANEKKNKLEEVIAKSRRLTDYMLFKPSSCAAVKNSDDETHSPGPGQSQDLDGEVEVVSSIKIIYYKSCRAPRPKWLLYCLKKFLKKV